MSSIHVNIMTFFIAKTKKRKKKRKRKVYQKDKVLSRETEIKSAFESVIHLPKLNCRLLVNSKINQSQRLLVVLG